MGVGGQCHAQAALPLGKTCYPLYRRLGGPQGQSGGVQKILPATGIQSPDRPARSESLHWLLLQKCLHISDTDKNLFKLSVQKLSLAWISKISLLVSTTPLCLFTLSVIMKWDAYVYNMSPYKFHSSNGKSSMQSLWSVFFILELLHTFKKTQHGLMLLILHEFACSSFLVGLLMMTGVIKYQDKVDLQWHELNHNNQFMGNYNWPTDLYTQALDWMAINA